MKNFAKILAMLLVLTMCMSLFCISAFADEISELEPDEDFEEVQPAAEQPAVEQPAADEPAADEPAADEPAADEPAAEEPAAEQPAAELEADDDEEEAESPLDALLAQNANAAGEQNSFFGNEEVKLVVSSWKRGDGSVSGYCAGLKDKSLYKNNASLKLCWDNGTDTGAFGQLDWYNYGNGNFYISASALGNLKPGDYDLWFKSLETGEETDTATLTIVSGPVLWPLETPKHVLGSAGSLSFVMTDDIGTLGDITSGLGYVMVGDVVLVEGRDYYLTKDGSGEDAKQAIITLSPYFMNKLTSGATYKLKVTDAAGNLATTNFSIVGYGTSTSSPRTGDESNIGLWAVLLLLSGTAAVVIMPRIKKHG